MNAEHTAAEQRAYREVNEQPELHPVEDALDYLRQYARENPEMAALTCLGIGFVLGWKLKPW